MKKYILKKVIYICVHTYNCFCSILNLRTCVCAGATAKRGRKTEFAIVLVQSWKIFRFQFTKVSKLSTYKKTATISFSILHRVAYITFYTSYQDTTVSYIVISKLRRFYQLFCHFLWFIAIYYIQRKSNFLYYYYFLQSTCLFTN